MGGIVRTRPERPSTPDRADHLRAAPRGRCRQPVTGRPLQPRPVRSMRRRGQRLPDPPQRRPAGAATTVTAVSFFATYGAVRTIRVLQEKGRLPAGGGLSIRGWHVHHYWWGLVLVAGHAAVAAGTHLPAGDPRRAGPLGAGLALVADELDILTDRQRSRAAQHRRPVVDANVLAAAALMSVLGGLRTRQTMPRPSAMIPSEVAD